MGISDWWEYILQLYYCIQQIKSILFLIATNLFTFAPVLQVCYLNASICYTSEYAFKKLPNLDSEHCFGDITIIYIV